MTAPDDHIDECIDAYEVARAAGDADLAAFLPPEGHPNRSAVLRELVRVDLEYGWEAGRPRPLEEYLRLFPALVEDRDAMGEIAFEEYRQRLLAGRTPSPAEYQRLYGVPTEGWPVVPNASADRTVVRACPPPVAVAPPAGEELLGFRLLAELGRGSFCRVYLARQPGLADRLVALKVGTRLFGEEQKLAQLQHTNVVPIYSAHQSGPVQALCMPYFGSTTLADLLRGLRERQSLPASGKEIVSTLQNRKSTIPDAAPPEHPTGVVASLAAASLPAKKSFAALETFGRLSYVEAVVWIGARLADGLAHAHERGIVHRDIKPSNVLLTDEGHPMLLDFNLSEDAKARDGSRPGGTPSYMAPEQLDMFFGGDAPADPRGDIFSLGVVLYELMTGRQPFPPPTALLSEAVPTMARQRRGPPPGLRKHNEAVSPAVEAVVRRCLEPDPARRYAGARELQQDLDRHLNHLPLLHTPEPSRRERVAKWAWRHPRLTSGGSVAALAAVLLLSLGLAAAWLWQHKLDRDAAEAFRRFRQEKLRADFAMGLAENLGSASLAEGVAAARRALALYGFESEAKWEEPASARRLAAADRERLRREAADLLWALARAAARQADAAPEAERLARLDGALRLNRRAASLLPSGEASRALWLQRAALAERAGQSALADEAKAEAARTPLGGARDRYLAAVELRENGRGSESGPLLREAVARLVEQTARDPSDFVAWFLRGNCHDLLLEDAEAESCYTACLALDPESAECYFNRAQAYARQRRWDRVKLDLDRVLALRDDLAEALAQRALAALESGDRAAAESDLTRAVELAPEQTRFLYWRATARAKRGDDDGARRDREEAMRRAPGDAASWVERGLARLPGDPKAALADFEKATRLDRAFFPAWQNAAHVYSDHLGRDEDALRAMDRVVSLRPDFVPGRLGRGVLLARLGRRDEAHREAKAARDRDAAPSTLYQAANIYALTSRRSPADAAEALPLLARALAGGFGLDVIDRDSDMDPIREHPEFRRLVRAARELRAGSSK